MPLGTETVRSPPTFFIADPNGDGQLTLADAGVWLERAFFLPGDWTLWAIARYAPSFAGALGINVPPYGGLWAGAISAVLWLLTIILLGVAYSYAVELDRRATRVMGRLWAEAARRLRVALVRLRVRFGRGGKKSVAPADVDTGVELSRLDARILSELALLEPGYVSSAIEVARTLTLPAEQIRDQLDALQRRGLVTRTLGGGDGESGYRLSRPGHGVLMRRLARPS